MRRAFTLVELLVVIAVLSIIAAIVAPVIIRSKRAAYNTVTRSNLRQAYIALQIYADMDGEYPRGPAAFETLSKAPMCDPQDYWRKDCEGEIGSPMIGSYAYARNLASLQRESEWDRYLEEYGEPALLISIFASDNRPLAYQGEVPNVNDCSPVSNCVAQNKVIGLGFSGSIKMVVLREPYSLSLPEYPLANWATLFGDTSKKLSGEQ